MDKGTHDKGEHLDRQDQLAGIPHEPHPNELEQLRQIIENRVHETDKRLIRYLLRKEHFNVKQFAEQLLLKMLLIKKHLLKSQAKDEELIEVIILELLYDDDVLIEEQSQTLLNDGQLTVDLLRDKRLIEKIFEERFVYIPRNPRLEGQVYLR